MNTEDDGDESQPDGRGEIGIASAVNLPHVWISLNRPPRSEADMFRVLIANDRQEIEWLRKFHPYDPDYVAPVVANCALRARDARGFECGADADYNLKAAVELWRACQ